MMKKNFFSSVCAALAAIFICSGCHSDLYYQAEAVDRAREFILKEAKELSLEERSFVRYNDPVLLHSPVVGSLGVAATETLHNELQQICVTWQIPGKEELYMVFGVSGARMDNWYPNRLLRKKYTTTKHPLKAASEEALTYARNNLYDQLSVAEFNMLRFDPPWLLRTNFELNINPEGKLSQAEKNKISTVWKQMVQYSLVWKFGEKNLVFSGMAKPGFAGWQIVFAGLIPAQEVAAHTVKVVKTPEEALTPIPEDDFNSTPAKGDKTEAK